MNNLDRLEPCDIELNDTGVHDTALPNTLLANTLLANNVRLATPRFQYRALSIRALSILRFSPSRMWINERRRLGWRAGGAQVHPGETGIGPRRVAAPQGLRSRASIREALPGRRSVKSPLRPAH
jgi:hypothetical protein